MVLSGEVYRLLTRKVETVNRRMVLFTLLHVVSNTFWILFISNSLQGLLFEVLFIGTGLGTIASTYSIWSIQTKVQNTSSIHWLVLHSLAVIFLFSRLNWSGDVKHEWAFILIFVYAQCVFLFFGGRVFLKVMRMDKIEPYLQKSIIVSSFVFCFIPLIVFFIQHFAPQYILLNVGFFFIVFAYLKKNRFYNQVISYQTNEQSKCDDFTKESKNVITHIGKKSNQFNTYKRKLEQLDIAYQEQAKKLSECIEMNSQLSKESAEKSIQIEQYKNRNDATIESVLLKYDLTKSQLEVVRMMVEGKSNTEIADALFIKEGVVRTHLSAAYRKVGTRGANKLRFFILKQIKSK